MEQRQDHIRLDACEIESQSTFKLGIGIVETVLRQTMQRISGPHSQFRYRQVTPRAALNWFLTASELHGCKIGCEGIVRNLTLKMGQVLKAFIATFRSNFALGHIY